MQAAPAPALPFRLGTIRIPEKISSQAFTPGAGPIRVPLRKVGYLDMLRVRITGTVTTGAATPDERPGFPYNIVQRFRLDVPGLADPISISGEHLKLWNWLEYHDSMLRPGFDPAAGAGAKANAYYDAKLKDVYPIALSTANAWELWFDVPVTRNLRDQRGLLPMGGDDEVVLEITPAALADIFDVPANVTATALTIEVAQYYYTPPVAGVAAPDTTFVVVYDQYEQAVVATGANDVNIRRDGVILGIVHTVTLDDDAYPRAPEGSITDLSFRINRDKRLDALPFVWWAKEQANRYLQPLPAGVVAYDQDFLQPDLPFYDGSFERFPNWIYTAGTTEIVSTVNIAAAAALDNARIVTSVKRLMRANRAG